MYSAYWGAVWATVVLAVFVLLFVLDFAFEGEGLRPIGQRVATWSKRYPIFAAAISLILGMMIGHFFLQCLGASCPAP
jgi:hypothetical protein